MSGKKDTTPQANEENNTTAQTPTKTNFDLQGSQIAGGIFNAENVYINTIDSSITNNDTKPQEAANLNSPKIFQAPPLPEYYVDRPEISQDLKQRLLGNSQTLVVSAIHGLGSVGKSTLAAAIAHDPDIQNHFRDGILWATLGQEPNTLQRLTDWVHGLGDYNYPVTDIHSTSLHLRTLLSDKAMLLVVDDAWIDKNNGWEHVQAFNVGSSRCCMLVTTRDASISNSLGASTYALDVMSDTQALELLTNKLKTSGKRLEQSDIKLAQALAEAVGYLPLALELAAVQIADDTTWQDLIQDIKQEIACLESLQDPGVRYISDEEKFKKLSLQASLHLSIKRLDEYDKECFAWLGVLPEDANITHKMAATLWGMKERDAKRILQYFRSQSLLLPGVVLDDGAITYKLHDLFHDLARNLLIAPKQPKRQSDLIGLGVKWGDAHTQLLDKYQQQTENNLWHTLPDDGYIHQYLVWHLEKAGKVEEIHQILCEDSANGNNGWYEVKERLGQTAGFLKDVYRAWELTKPEFAKNPSRTISLQCRYGLIISSLNSLSANIPKDLLIALIKYRYWKPEQGLAYALQKQDFIDKANSLIAIADYLPEKLKKQALQAALLSAQQIQDEYSRAYAISYLAEKLQSQNLYYEALQITRQIKFERGRADVISYLLELLESENLYNQALEIIRQIKTEEYRVNLLSSLAYKLQSESLYNEALEAAHQISSDFYRSYALLALAEKIQSESLYNESLNITRQIKDEYQRAILLLSSAKKLQSESLYNEALEATRQIPSDRGRADALLYLAEQLQSENLYNEALEIINLIPDEDYRSKSISSLVLKLPETLYKKALKIASSIKFNQGRIHALSSLSLKIPAKLCKTTLQAARLIEDEYSHVLILLSIIEKLPESTSYHDILKITSQIPSEDYRSNILLSLVPKLPEDLYEEALKIASQIQSEKERTKVIFSLIAQLPENLYEELLKIVSQIQSEKFRAKILSSLVPKLPVNLYPRVLTLARNIEDNYSRANILSSLFSKLPSSDLYDEILETAYKIQYAFPRADILLSLASSDFHSEVLEILQNQLADSHFHDSPFLIKKLQENLSPENLDTLNTIEIEGYENIFSISLAQKIPEKFYPKILERVRQIRYAEYRVYILLCLISKFPSSSLYSEVLETLHQIHDNKYRAYAFLSLALKFPSTNLYNQILELVQVEILHQIQDEKYCANILLLLVTNPSYNLPNNLYTKILKITHQIQNEKYRANVLSSIALKLPEILYSEMLEIAYKIQNKENRTSILSNLLKIMSLNKQDSEIYNMWLGINENNLSEVKRQEFQENEKLNTDIGLSYSNIMITINASNSLKKIA